MDNQTILKDLIENIKPLDEDAINLAHNRQDHLTKPLGSLGRLESISLQVAGITRSASPNIQHKAVIVMAADHGVIAEGVSAYPQAVTAQMVQNFLRGGAAINVLAKLTSTRVVVVDIGVVSDLDVHPNLLIKKISHGTSNIARGPAMTHEQAIASIQTGIEVVQSEINRGLDILATGEMGIGNTTPSAAIATVITGLSAPNFIGRGTGIDDHGLKRKLAAVEQSLAINQPNSLDGLDILAKVGGYEIAGLTGVILAAAANHRPVVIDGFISTAAALIATTLAPQSRDYMIAGHRSPEVGHEHMLEWLKLTPLLDLQMHLGEGTGAVLAMSLVETACHLLTQMATFSEANISGKLAP